MTITTPRTVALTEGTVATYMRPGATFEPVEVERLIGTTWALVSIHKDDSEPFYARRSELVTHADYPHLPGYLSDCYACLAACHCGDATCVHCEDEIGHTEAEEWEYAGDLYPDTDLTFG